MARLSVIHELAAARSAEAHDRQAAYFDAGRRELTFEIGDLVWRRNRVLSSAAQGVAAKLAHKFAGPYLIRARLSSGVYKLLDDEGNADSKVHAEHFKEYYEGRDLEDDEDDARPLREATAMSDPPPASEEQRASATQTASASEKQRASAARTVSASKEQLASTARTASASGEQRAAIARIAESNETRRTPLAKRPASAAESCSIN